MSLPNISLCISYKNYIGRENKIFFTGEELHFTLSDMLLNPLYFFNYCRFKIFY